MEIIIITASPPPKENQTRLDTLETSANIMNDTIPKIMASGFNGIFLIATNPVDIITYHVWKLSGLPRHQVIGTGTSIDSSRLKTYLSDILHVDIHSIQGYTMGEHSDSQFAVWSHLTIGGKPFLQNRYLITTIVLFQHLVSLTENTLNTISVQEYQQLLAEVE